MQFQSSSVFPLETSCAGISEDFKLEKQVQENYEKVLTFTNMKFSEQICYRSTKISNQDYIHQIYTNNDTSLPHLVFIHGFGGNPMNAFRMFKLLSTKFQVHALDIFGFGFSSRGNFSNQFTYEQARDYYIKPIERWRKIQQIQRFVLVGHSFGGYISSAYAFAYPQRINHLILASPASASQFVYFTPKNQDGCLKKILIKMAKCIYNLNLTPSKIIQTCLFGKIFVSKVIKSLRIPEEQRQNWKQYYQNVHSNPESSEVGLYRLFEYPIRGKFTIQEMIRNNPPPFGVDFYFGEKDWMPRQGPDRLVSQGFYGITVSTVPKSGHQIIINNPQYLCEGIITKSKIQAAKLIQVKTCSSEITHRKSAD